jgi:head-tail adaptor
MARLTAGELDRRIILLRGVPADDGFTTTPGAPAQIGRRWAKKVDISDGERIRASQNGQDVTTRFVVRSDALTRTIVGADSISCRGRTYAVIGAKESVDRDDAIEITAVATPDVPE